MGPILDPVAASKSTKSRCPLACNLCRAKKIRCNGGKPCTNCRDYGEECVVTSRRHRRPRARSAHPRPDMSMAERLSRLEAVLAATQPASSDISEVSELIHPIDRHRSKSTQLISNSEHPCNKPTESSPNVMPPSDQNDPLETTAHDYDFASSSPTMNALFHTADEEGDDSLDFSVLTGMSSSSPPTSQQNLTTHQQQPWFRSELCSSTNSRDSSLDEPEEADSGYTEETSNWEYHGPRSFLSICSKPGVQWVAKQTGSPSFHEVTATLIGDVTRRLKIERKLSKERLPEPDADTAWIYVRAYFDASPDAVFGVVERQWFENRLRSHLSYAGVEEEDSAWYALRNAVYASGCRLELTVRGKFREACQAAWKYFENALSVHTEILYFKTSLLAVQALTVMAYFTSGVGSPCLEYMLGANAARLAYSLGLHRKSVSSWNLNPSEEFHRTCLFWAIYCLDKNCSRHSGRPSAINDHEVSCQLLTRPPHGDAIDIEYINHLIRLAKLMSQVAEKLSVVEGPHSSPKGVVNTVTELESRHVELGDILGDLASLETPLDRVKLPANMSLQQATYILLTYFSIGLDIHTILTRPWSWLRKYPMLHARIQKSTHTATKLARALIHSTHFVRIHASTPVLLAFGAPMSSLIHLFTHILQNPGLPTAQSDVALMDIGAAHFAHLEFASESDISIIFAKEIAALARSVVTYHRNISLRASCVLVANDNLSEPTQEWSKRGLESYNGNPYSPKQGQVTDRIDLEPDYWSAFLAPDPFF